jgi:ribosomal protein L37AE/L43A
MSRNMVKSQKGSATPVSKEVYGGEEQCHAALVQSRWPAGFECPDCGSRGHCIVNRGARRLFQCNACRKQTSVKAGTMCDMFRSITLGSLNPFWQAELPSRP